MPLVLIESFEEFSRRHGGNPVSTGHRLVFPTGAQCDDMEGSQRWEPPADATALLHARKKYVSARLRQAEGEFHQTQSAFSEQAALAATYGSNVPPPPFDSKEILLGLKATGHTLRNELKEIEVQLAQTPDAIFRQQQAQQVGERRQQIAVLHGEINGVSLE